MRTFAQKQSQSQKRVSSRPARSKTATPGRDHREHPNLPSQRAIGNQEMQRLLETQNETLEVGSTNTASSREGETLGPLRTPMESTFGSDFSRVRIHRDSRADDLNARAVTRGEDIHLGRGEDPKKPDGRELVAHELAHVVQQRNASGLSA